MRFDFHRRLIALLAGHWVETLGGFWYDYEQDVTDITFSGNTPDGTDNSGTTTSRM